MIKSLCAIGLFMCSASLSAQKVETGTISDFILPGYSILDSALGDFNGDKRPDMVLILKNIHEEDSTELTRPLLVLMGKAGGSFLQIGRNDSIVLCKGCGGVWGNPFDGLTVKGMFFSIEHYGGSRYRWTKVITFRYDDKLKNFVLYRDAGINYDNTNPEVVDDVLYNKTDWGKLRFKNYINRFFN